jgi:hypothetical protein
MHFRQPAVPHFCGVTVPGEPDNLPAFSRENICSKSNAIEPFK